MKTIPNFDIPDRDLTEEEATRPLSYERINEWEEEVCESFADYNDMNANVFVGYILGMRPDMKKEIMDLIKEANEFEYKRGDIYMNDVVGMFREFYSRYKYPEGGIYKSDSEDEEHARREFYTLYSNFLNQFPGTLAELNKQLILVLEYSKN